MTTEALGPVTRLLQTVRSTQLSRAAAAIEPQLDSFFDSAVASASNRGASYERLWSVARDQACGGKLLRPALFLCALDAFRGANDAGESRVNHGEPETDLAVAIELLHFSFLLHDDVIDGDVIRRGKPNFITSIVGEVAEPPASLRMHWGQSAAILMGNLLLAEVHQRFARVDVDHSTRLRLLELLDTTIQTSVAGELVDVELSAGVTSGDQELVLETSLRKTAVYSFELPLRAAAILSGATPDVEMVLTRAARSLGLAFQLQDDLLSVFGDEAMHGKDFCSDLREGKVTAIIAHARSTPAWPIVKSALGRQDLTADDALHIRELLEAHGTAAHVNELIEQELGALNQIFAEHDGALPEALTTLIKDTAESLRGRMK